MRQKSNSAFPLTFLIHSVHMELHEKSIRERESEANSFCSPVPLEELKKYVKYKVKKNIEH